MWGWGWEWGWGRRDKAEKALAAAWRAEKAPLWIRPHSELSGVQGAAKTSNTAADKNRERHTNRATERLTTLTATLVEKINNQKQ